MRDAFKIKGEKIIFQDKIWEIGEVHYVPNNPNLYVELKDNGLNMNVRLNEIIEPLVSTNNTMIVMDCTS